MPYISTEAVKQIRNTLKEQMPDFKLSVRKRHGHAVDVAIMKGPVDFGSTYAQVNHFYIPEQWGDRPDACDCLMMIHEIVSDSQRTVTVCHDYGAIPNYYVSISVGKWDQPYVQIGSN
jgi:hypothetical protein